MRQVVLSDGGGKYWRDTNGNSLVAIGNVTYQAGDAVWTDGRCIYGWVRPNQPQNVAPVVSVLGVPWLVAPWNDTATAWALPTAAPADYRRLGKYDGASWGGLAYPSFVVGTDDVAYILKKRDREAINLDGGSTFTLATPTHGTADTANIADALMDDDGALMALETYQDADGYYGFAVHRGGSIIDEVQHIDGNIHLGAFDNGLPWDEIWTSGGVTMVSCLTIVREDETQGGHLVPLALHLREDGTFCGTLSEDAGTRLLADSDSIHEDILNYSMGGVVMHVTTRGTFSPSSPSQVVADITAASYRFMPPGESEYYTFSPFADVSISQRTETVISSGAVFTYDNGTKTEVYRQDETNVIEYYAPVIAVGGGYDITADYYMTGDDSGNLYPYRITCTHCLVNYDSYGNLTPGKRYLRVRVLIYMDGEYKDIASAFFAPELLDDTSDLTENGWYGIENPTKTETTQAYSFDVGAGTVSCTTTASRLLTSKSYALGAAFQYRYMPQFLDGTASCLGVTFNQRDNAIYDIKRIDTGKYLILTAKGLYYSNNGSASLIHSSFAATGGYDAYGGGRHLNGRINTATISRIKAGLEDISR